MLEDHRLRRLNEILPILTSGKNFGFNDRNDAIVDMVGMNIARGNFFVDFMCGGGNVFVDDS